MYLCLEKFANALRLGDIHNVVNWSQDFQPILFFALLTYALQFTYLKKKIGTLFHIHCNIPL